MFDLRIPCVNCPFRKGVGETFQLDPRRLEEIRGGVGFVCHKTVDYSRGRSRITNKSQQCAGFMSVMRNDWGGSPMMQLAQRMMGTDFSDLDPKREAYDSWDDVKRAHNGD